MSSTWAKLGPVWRSWARKLCLAKTLISLRENHDFAGSGASNKRCKLDARGQLGPTRAIFEQLGTTLAQSCSNLEPTWDQLEPSWGQLGANLEPIWANLDQLGDNLGHYGQLGAIVAPTWANLAAISANFGPTCQKRCSKSLAKRSFKTAAAQNQQSPMARWPVVGAQPHWRSGQRAFQAQLGPLKRSEMDMYGLDRQKHPAFNFR